jgi:uncharacterized protein YbbC (DUF1343 family)/CubicO group peptidase (beta-lactamase class C family)
MIHLLAAIAIDQAINTAIAEHKLPGGVLWMEHNGKAVHRAYGKRALVPRVERMTEDTIFDAASLTKVTATTTSIWILIERGRIGLDDPVSKFIPEFHGGWRDEVTIRHLLTHTSGLRPDLDLTESWSGYDEAIRRASEEMPLNRPGYVFRYSDINFELLGEIVRRVSGKPLDEFARREVFEPLGMRDTSFRPCHPERPRAQRGGVEGPPSQMRCGSLRSLRSVGMTRRIAPTEFTDGVMLRGVVHDPTARRMGGVAGHAGLFTTARDLAKYARCLLNGGAPILKRETVNLLTSVNSPPNVAVKRAGGFDLDSGYSRPRGDLFPIGSYGHTGFTGGMMWIDPSSKTFYVFLSNRVHPDGKGDVLALQRTLGTEVARWAEVGRGSQVAGRRVEWVIRGANVLNGIDALHADHYRALQGLRVGLITNHTGIDRAGNPTIDLLRSAPGVNVIALFSPEHGIRGNADEKLGDTTDAVSGLPIFSLYGERRKPSTEQLSNLDALVFDIQDIGARFYTYPTTMSLAMEAAAEAHKKFIVLDRVNPIGGAAFEGPIAEGEWSFISFHPIVVRHGMTVGELARMFKDEKHLDVDLEVIQLKGWKREMWQDDAGLPWINTSPNMRSLNAAALYPGIGLVESAMSVGRGTATPFEIAGAPYVDPDTLASEMNTLNLPGIRFEPVHFTPEASTFKNQLCGGVRFVITDRKALKPVTVGVALATTVRRLYGEQFEFEKMAGLLRKAPILEAIRKARPVDEIAALWQADEATFAARRANYLIYH